MKKEEIDYLINDGKKAIKARSKDIKQTKQYKMMFGGNDGGNVFDTLNKLTTGVIEGIDKHGRYLVEAGKKNIIISESKYDYKIGDTVTVYTKDGIKGNIDLGKVHEKLQDSLINQSIIVLENIENVGKGGFKAFYDGVAIFIPGSLIDFNVCRDFSEFDGATVEVIIISQNNETDYNTGESIVTYTASRKAVLHKKGEEDFELVQALPKKTTYTGIITGFGKKGQGAFIEFQEYYLNGFIFNLNTSSNKKGDLVHFKILSVDRKKRRLTLKQTNV